MISSDSLYRSIKQKIDFIKYIAPKISQLIGVTDEINEILNKIRNTEDKFNMQVSPIIIHDKTTGLSSTNEFLKILNSEHVENVIESAAKSLYNMLTGGRKIQSKEKKTESVLIKQLETHFESMNARDMCKKELQNFMICDKCLEEMIIDAEKS